MLGKNLIKAAAGAGGEATDENFANTVLLLHGDGNQGATNFSNAGDPTYLAFKDNSDNNFPITVNGDAYGDNFGPYALDDGNWSNYFDGVDDKITTPSSADFGFGTGDFHISFWAYLLSDANKTIFGNVSDNLNLYVAASTKYIGLYTGSVNDSTTVAPVNQWAFFVVTRTGTTLQVYMNGSSILSITNSTNFATTSYIIGANSGSSFVNAYISNFKIVKGSPWTPTSNPTAPSTSDTNTKLLTCQSNRFVDNSSNNFTITPAGNVSTKVFNPFGELPDGVNGSGFFDGTGDFIGYPADTALAFGTGDYTVECWVYFTAINSTDLQILFSSGSTGDSFFFHADGNQLSVGTSSVFVSSQSATFVIGTWYHVVACRSGGTLRLFQNGVQVGSSVSDSTNWVSSGTPRIGANGIGTQTVSGYVSNSRVVKGTALYTANFTPPTAPLTNVTNTQLLTCQYAGTVRNVGFIDSGPYDFPITRVGNTTQGSFSPFSKPDGRWGALTSDRAFITIPASSDFDLINTDFTVEFWWNPVAFNTMAFSGNVLFGNGLATANHGWATEFGGSGTTVTSVSFFTWASGARTNNVFTVSIPFGTWVHVAFVRSGSSSGNLKCYVNGVQQGAAQNAATYSTAGSTFVLGSGGYRQNPTYSGNAAYYISNVRLTKSAIYTAAFTPSTAPLTAISGTTLLILQSNRFINNGTNSGAITSSSDSVVRTRITPFSPFPITTEYSPSVKGGSGYFDGSGDYLTLADNAALNLDSGDFTVQCWFYALNTTSIKPLVVRFNGNATGRNDLQFFITINSGSLQITPYLSTTDYTMSFANLTANAWHHCALVRTGNNFYAYLDGVRNATTQTISGSLNNNAWETWVGGYREGGTFYYQNGYIAAAQIIKGTALYTGSTYTVPSLPPTAITNTSLLCNFTNAGIYDTTGFNNLETVGNAQIDTTTKKFGTGAMKFDGTGDNLTIASNPSVWLGGGPFTIEMWLYPNDASSQQMLVAGSDTGSIFVGMNIDGANRIALGRKGVAVDNFVSYTYSTGAWIHLAVTRDSSNNVRFYVDGTQVGSTGSNSNSFTNSALNIGFEPTQKYLNGFVDDLRITKLARYTGASFTPPDKAFPNIGS